MGSAGGGEFGVKRFPGVDGREGDEGEEGVVEFIGVARIGPGFGGDEIDGGCVEDTGAMGDVGADFAAEFDGPGAAFFEGGVVEEGVGVGVEDLVAEGGGAGSVDGYGADGAGLDTAEDVFETANIHGLVETVLHGLADEGMVGNDGRAGKVFGAGDLVGENGGEEVFGAHADDVGGGFTASTEAQDGEGAGGVPAPAGVEHGGGEEGLAEDIFDGRFAEEFEDEAEGERVLVTEGEDEAVVSGGGL